jgi:Holliday junction resolvase
VAAEAKLQSKIITDLKSEGWLVNKIMLCSNQGWPDVEAYKQKRTIFIEVKSEGKKAAPLQQYRHKQLIDQGFEVYVIDTWDMYLNIKQTRFLVS